MPSLASIIETVTNRQVSLSTHTYIYIWNHRRIVGQLADNMSKFVGNTDIIISAGMISLW